MKHNIKKLYIITKKKGHLQKVNKTLRNREKNSILLAK